MKPRGNPKLTYERASELLEYNEQTGDLIWKVNRRAAARVGDIAGYIIHVGDINYIQVCVDGVSYLAHRVIWLMINKSWPENLIDHIDGNGLNNTKSNIRDVTQQENNRNKSISKLNKTGVSGVVFNSGAFEAWINVDKKEKYLGRFKTVELAAEVRRSAEVKYGYHANHGRLSNV